MLELVRTLQQQRAMDEFGSVSLVLDQDSRIVYYNLPAERLLGEDDGLGLSADGKLEARSAQARQRLAQAIETCLSAVQCNEDGGAAFVQIERPSGKPPYLVFLWPCRAGEVATGRGPGLLVVVNDPDQSEHTIQGMLSNLYALTPSEAQVAMHLLQGQSAKGIAEERGVSITTVRTQIRNLLMKTDTQRQSEFIALVFRCLSLMVR